MKTKMPKSNPTGSEPEGSDQGQEPINLCQKFGVEPSYHMVMVKRSFRIEKDIDNIINKLVSMGYYTSASDLVRQALNYYLEELII